MKKINVNKNKVKVMDLDTMFYSGEKTQKEYVEFFEEIVPVFNRDGFYYDRFLKLSWYEFNGQAWINSGAGFPYQLERTGNNRMHPKVFDGLSGLRNWNILTKKQIKDLEIEQEEREYRKRYIEFSIRFNKFIKEKNLTEKIIKNRRAKAKRI